MRGLGPKAILATLVLITAMAARTGAAAKPDVWLEVKSPHFTVISDANEKQARRVAYRFEQIRAVFQLTFGNRLADPIAPIIVLAAKNDKSFQALAPADFTQKGALKRSGLFQQTSEKNYVLLNLGAPGETPFHVLFHEYTHLLMHQNTPEIPLWLDEGLAEFYGYTEIHEKEIWLGRASENHVTLLRESRLIPLPTLFTVGHDSPYYHEENKGSMFYAESWALTHYLMLKDLQERKTLLSAYLTAVNQGSDAATAAENVFGDLAGLEKQLGDYVRGSQFQYLRMKASPDVNEDAFQLRELSPAESDAARGDFLVYLDRYDDARVLLAEALQLDPHSAPAAESMGFLEFHQDHIAEAEKWFTQAVALNSRSYLAHYNYAVMTLGRKPDAAASAQVEKSLRSAIEINPQFAPAYDALAQLFVVRGQNLDEAHMLAARAISLDPGNFRFYLTAANVSLRMQDPANALRICQKAHKLAKSPQEVATVETLLESATRYQRYLDERKKAEEVVHAGGAAGGQTPSSGPGSVAGQEVRHFRIVETGPPVLRRREAPRGPRDMAEGVIRNVKCALPSGLEMDVQTSHQTFHLHSDNYFSVQYSALNFTPSETLNPCHDLEGMKARAIFFDVPNTPDEGELISVELRK